MKRIVLIAAIAFAFGQVGIVEAVENAANKTKAAAAAKHPGGTTAGSYQAYGYGYGHSNVYPNGHSFPDVGYNYYGFPGTGVMASSMYPAPRPTPMISGHTMYTYQPLMPHEHMYEHSRDYYTPYGGPEAFYQDPYGRPSMAGGYTKTSVRYQSGVNRFAPSPWGMYTYNNMVTMFDRFRARGLSMGCNTGPDFQLFRRCR